MNSRLVKLSYYLLLLIMGLMLGFVVIKWLLPLFFSCLLVAIIHPLLQKQLTLLNIKHLLLIKAIIVINYLLFITLLVIVFIFGIRQLYQGLQLLPGYLSDLYYLLSYNQYLIDFGSYLDIIYSGSLGLINNISHWFINGILTFVVKIPGFIFDLMFVFVCSLFILLDYDQIERKLLQPYPIVSIIIETINNVLSNLFKAYFIIMLVTFGLLYLGLTILQVDRSLMLSMCIALFDFFPILGIDMIMIPWIIISALINDVFLAFGLLVLYIVVVIIKNILEPKILAQKLGLNPVASLISMFVGMNLMGITGLFIVPVTILILMEILKVKGQLGQDDKKDKSC